MKEESPGTISDFRQGRKAELYLFNDPLPSSPLYHSRKRYSAQHETMLFDFQISRIWAKLRCFFFLKEIIQPQVFGNSKIKQMYYNMLMATLKQWTDLSATLLSWIIQSEKQQFIYNYHGQASISFFLITPLSRQRPMECHREILALTLDTPDSWYQPGQSPDVGLLVLSQFHKSEYEVILKQCQSISRGRKRHICRAKNVWEDPWFKMEGYEVKPESH